MSQPICNPLGIFLICLAPWNRFDMLSIDNQQLKVTFEHVINGFPEHSRTLHRHMSYSQTPQPVTHLGDLLRHRAERPPLFVSLATNRWSSRTGHHCPLMDVQARTPFIDHLHVFPPSQTLDDNEDRQPDAKSGSKIPLRASRCRERQTVVLAGIQITLLVRLTARVSNRSFLLHLSSCHSIFFQARWCAGERMSHCWRMGWRENVRYGREMSKASSQEGSNVITATG